MGGTGRGATVPGQTLAVAVIVFFHAHPDDEAIFTGGTIAQLSDAGHRVVVVVATGGELGLPHAPAAAGDTALGRRPAHGD